MGSDEFSEIALVGEYELDPESGEEPQFVKSTELERVTGRDLEGGLRSTDRNAQLLEHQPRRQRAKRLVIDFDLGKIDDGHVELTSDGL